MLKKIWSDGHTRTQGFARLLIQVECWLLAITIFLLPHWFFPIPAAVDFAKQWLLVVGASVALLCWSVAQFLQGEIRLRFGLPHGLAALLLATMVASTAWSSYRYGSLVGTTSVATSLLSMASFGVLFFLLANRPEGERRKWLGIAAMSVAVHALSTFLQFVGWSVYPWGFARGKDFTSVGSFNDAIFFLVSLLPLLLVMTMMAKRQVVRIVFGLSIVLVLATVHLAGSSAAWLFVGITTVLCIALFRSTLTVRGLVSLGFLAVVAAVSFVFPRPLVSVGVPVEVGLSQRVSMEITTRTLQENIRHLLIGRGPSTYGESVSLYRPTELNSALYTQGSEVYPLWAIRFTSPASAWWLLLGTIGILGAVLFLAMLFATMLAPRSVEKADEAILGRALVALILAAVVSMALHPAVLAILFFLWIAAALLASGASERSFSVAGKQIQYAALAVASLVVVASLAGLAGLGLQTKRVMAETKAQQALAAATAEQLEVAVQRLVEATQLASHEDRYWRVLADNSRLYFVSLTRETPINEPALRNALLQTIQASRQAQALNPSNVANYTALATIYQQVAPFFDDAANLAVETIVAAEQLEPTNPVLPTEEARSYLIAADYADRNIVKVSGQTPTQDQLDGFRRQAIEKAAKALDRALALKADYASARYLRAIVATRQGNSEQAFAELDALLRAHPDDASIHYEIGVLNYRLNRFGPAEEALKKAVELDSQFSNARYFLGLIADRQGRSSEAIAHFEAILKSDPRAKEVQTILENLRAGRPALTGIVPGVGVEPSEVPLPETPPEQP